MSIQSLAATADLLAGRTHVDVGDVTISDDGVNLYVTYDLNEGCYLTTWHVEIKQLKSQVPSTNGGPIPGQFTYSGQVDYANDFSTGPLSLKGLTGNIVVLIHGGVTYWGGIDNFELTLPLTATLTIDQSAYCGGPSFWPGVKITEGGILNGVHNAWCVNMGQYIDWGTFDVDVISTYSSDANTIVDKPQNLDLVNYIINQNYVGKTSPSGGVYTYSEVQLAIWTLIDDEVDYADSGLCISNLAQTQAHVAEIVAAATAHGEGFQPVAGQKLGVLLQPESVSWLPGTPQALLIDITIPGRTGTDTIWAGLKKASGGYDYPWGGSSWALYLKYNTITDTLY